jgi:hypothetical protein
MRPIMQKLSKMLEMRATEVAVVNVTPQDVPVNFWCVEQTLRAASTG